MKLEEFYLFCEAITPDERGCMNWPRAADPRGYGRIGFKRNPIVSVTRLILTRKLGRPIGFKLYALHHCDNPRCVNPEHLYEGTNSDNQKDRVLRNPGSFKRRK